MHGGHRRRIKNKYLLDGIDKFNEHEIIELILYYAIPRKNTNEIAHALLDKFGTLSAVFDASISMLKEVEGMGESAAIFIKAIRDLTRAYLDSKFSPKGKIMSLQEACDKLSLQFIGRDEEVVAIMLFDAKFKVLYYGVVNKGTVSAVDLYFRKIVELIMLYNASSIIVAHNHPSGVAVPSKDDLDSTEKMSILFKNMGVKFVDHIIVADGDYVSLNSSSKESIEEAMKMVNNPNFSMY